MFGVLTLLPPSDSKRQTYLICVLYVRVYVFTCVCMCKYICVFACACACMMCHALLPSDSEWQTYVCCMYMYMYSRTSVCVSISVCVCLCVCVYMMYVRCAHTAAAEWPQMVDLCVLLCCMHGVATISRLLKIIGLFCRIQFLLYGSFAKETYNFEDPTNRSHPICVYVFRYVCLLV